jgi:iron complex transport system substrate-binding protein
MKSVVRRGLLAALACLPMWAMAAIEVPDHRGGTLKLAEPPRRIVSLLPSITEGLCALGGCARLVGTDRFSNYPAEVQALPKLGGLEDAQVERIVTLKPDVVIAAPSARVVGRLEKLGLKVLVIDTNTHAEVRKGLQTLATLLGTPEQGVAAWTRIERDIATAVTRVPPSLRGARVFFEIDGSGYAAGRVSFIGETLTRLGVDNIVPKELGPFPRLNPEFIVRSQPDIIMALDRSFDEMPRRPGWSAVRAVQAHRGCGFSLGHYDMLVRPGPRMGEAALLLADCLVSIDKAR